MRQRLSAAARGDRKAGAAILPLVYDELRRLAWQYVAKAGPGQTLQATALVHEAYLRTVGGDDPGWDGRSHFFCAAAQAMRQIMVDEARRRGAIKRGGDRTREPIVDVTAPIDLPLDDILAVDEALDHLEARDGRKHQVVMLRFFVGLTTDETAAMLGLSTRTVQRDWRFARAWLHRELGLVPPPDRDDEPESPLETP